MTTMLTHRDNDRLYKFFEVRYKEILQKSFNDEQLYFYFAIKTLGFKDILTAEKDAVLKSDNQILISYYLKDKIFENEDIDILKANINEQYWFQNYHLILYSPDLLADIENSIDKYLIPKNEKKNAELTETQKKSYMAFYKENLELENAIIRDIPDVNTEIRNYLFQRIQESEADFETKEDLDI